MSNTHIYPIVHWKTYLVPSKNKRVERFLKTNGVRVFKNLHKRIKEAIADDIPMVVILVHPNVTSLIVIKRVDYITVLEHCILYFESIENYKMCSTILKTKKKLVKETEKIILIENG